MNANRHAQGAYRHLTADLRSDALLFRWYFRVSIEQSDDLLSQVEDRIQYRPGCAVTGRQLLLSL